VCRSVVRVEIGKGFWAQVMGSGFWSLLFIVCVRVLWGIV